MIGLKQGTVRLSRNYSKWAKAFEREKKRILPRLKGKVLGIEHIGSTAIKDIPAKPIIDIGVGIKSMKDYRKLIAPLKALGYEWRKHIGNPSNHLFFVKGPTSKRTHYIHLYKHNGMLWTRDVLFRDYLNTHKGRAKQYAILKQRLAVKHKDNRNLYTEGKKPFIAETVRRARKLYEN